MLELLLILSPKYTPAFQVWAIYGSKRENSWQIRPQKEKKPGKQEHYLFNFVPSELALPPDDISVCSHKSQYFPVSPFTIDFYVGHINGMWNYLNYILPSVRSK